jgi:aspartate-semialdehyde dehydrogenase
MMKVGLVGWRGMVGSVLMQRMDAERDFDHIDPVFFSTSNVGGEAPRGGDRLQNATSIDALRKMDTIITCQGGDYTTEVFGKLRAAGWQGYWIDAASTLRMHDEAVIVLDPLNLKMIQRELSAGKRNFIGSNCTVGLMMMGLAGLLRENMIEWVTAMTYQAASGGGAQHMRELISQMGHSHRSVAEPLADPNSAILDIDRKIAETMRGGAYPTEHFGVPLAGSLIPWIDKDLGNGIAKEEWKGDAELNKILGLPKSGSGHIPVESICVRIGVMRCHSQALTIKLRQSTPISDVESVLASGNEWVRLVPNNKEASVVELTPTAVTGRMHVAIGRVRPLAMGQEYYSAFTVGDQLLWGAAEPLRRMLRILLTHSS